jgi:cytochrome c biogenesis protein CcdA
VVVASIILSFIIVDMVFSFAGTTVSVSANWEIALFVVIASAYGISQYLILDFIKNKPIQIRKRVPPPKKVKWLRVNISICCIRFGDIGKKGWN